MANDLPALKPCAHCGHSATYKTVGTFHVKVECSWCGIQTTLAAALRYDVAARQWNKRPEDSKRQARQIVEMCKTTKRSKDDEDEDEFDT